MKLEHFLTRLDSDPTSIDFEDTIKLIDSHYNFTPTAFHNGELHNTAEQNQGSCKLLAFASLQQLNPAQTLACFGRYYRDEVLGQPDASNHQNIRNFMQTGWDGVQFEYPPLSPKAEQQ